MVAGRLQQLVVVGSGILFITRADVEEEDIEPVQQTGLRTMPLQTYRQYLPRLRRLLMLEAMFCSQRLHD